MTVSYSTIAQLQFSMYQAYENVAYHIQLDTSTAGVTVNAAMDTFFALGNSATIANILDMRLKLKAYQAQLSDQITYFMAAEVLMYNVKVILMSFRTGYISLDTSLAKEIVIGNSGGSSTDQYLVTLSSGFGAVPIGPKAATYLNKCTLTDSVYTVGGAIFKGFDLSSTGLLLSSMTNLNSLSGHNAALAQCGTWGALAASSSIYATTTFVGGTTGDATATGCQLVATAGDAMALCHSVFDMS